MVLSIENASYLGDYKIRLVFSDNNEQVIDFKPFLSKALNPMAKKYLDKDKFANFKIEYGDLQWNDYELCFPIADLYKGKID